MQNTTLKKEYDLALKNKAMTRLLLRIVVAGYIGYLAWKVLSGMMNGTSPIPVWAVWLICIVMTAVALGFCVFSWKAYQKALKAAEVDTAPASISVDSIMETTDTDAVSGIQADQEISDTDDQ